MFCDQRRQTFIPTTSCVLPPWLQIVLYPMSIEAATCHVKIIYYVYYLWLACCRSSPEEQWWIKMNSHVYLTWSVNPCDLWEPNGLVEWYVLWKRCRSIESYVVTTNNQDSFNFQLITCCILFFLFWATLFLFI